MVQVVGSLHASQWGSHGGGSHDAVVGSSVYPVLHDPQIWAPSVVQAVPVAAVPWAAQVQPVQDSAMEPPPANSKVLISLRSLSSSSTQAPQSFWLKALA